MCSECRNRNILADLSRIYRKSHGKELATSALAMLAVPGDADRLCGDHWLKGGITTMGEKSGPFVVTMPGRMVYVTTSRSHAVRTFYAAAIQLDYEESQLPDWYRHKATDMVTLTAHGRLVAKHEQHRAIDKWGKPGHNETRRVAV